MSFKPASARPRRLYNKKPASIPKARKNLSIVQSSTIISRVVPFSIVKCPEFLDHFTNITNTNTYAFDALLQFAINDLHLVKNKI